ncbi:MAG: single-stranded DNA-binding protein [Terriglobia bacterium]
MSARSINRVTLIGHLGQDARTQFTASGKAITRFSVATSRSFKSAGTDEWKEETNWTNIVLWEQEKLADYLNKGQRVYVDGRLQSRSYDDRDGRKVYTTEVIAQEVLLLGSRGDLQTDGAEPQRAPRNARPEAPQQSEDNFGITEDDIPF